MALRRVSQGGGLVTDPSALQAGEMAAGAMRQASNCMIHRPGVIQPRPGFGDTTGIATRTDTYRPLQAITFDGDMVVVSFDEDLTPDGWQIERLSVDTQYTGVPSDVIGGWDASTVTGRMALMLARRNLYVAGADGVKVLDGIANNFRRAGVWMTFATATYSFVDATTTTRRAIDCSAADASVAYRWVIRRTDAHGYEKRSASSSRIYLTGVKLTFPTGLYINWNNFYLPKTGQGWHVEAGDVIEIYRTPQVTGGTDPGEDYYLAVTHEITSAEVTAGVVSANIVDDTVEAQLGVALYSSSSQRGALSAKFVPPNCHTLAWWGGVAWAGATIERSTLRFSITKIGTTNDGLGYVTGTWTGNTGARLDGVSLSAAEWLTLRAGQYLAGTSGPGLGSSGITSGSKIVSWDSVAQTITITTTPTYPGGATAPLKAGDIISIGTLGSTTDFYIYATESVALRWVKNSSWTTATPQALAESLSRVVSGMAAQGTGRAYVYKDVFPYGVGDGEVLVIDTTPEQTTGDAGLFVYTTKEASTVPDIKGTGTWPGAGGLWADPDKRVHPSRVQWSAPDEPEAWPPANYTDIGEEAAYVLATVPLLDALIVFKEDGVFRITGTAPSNWVVDKLGVHRLLASSCACVLGDTCYAWTDLGVVAVHSGGIEPGPISAARGHVFRDLAVPLGAKNRNYKHGYYMEAHERLGLVILATAESATAENPSLWHVWHVSTGAWTTWSRTDAMCAYDTDEARLVVGLAGDSWVCLYERSDEDAAASYRDRVSASITPTSFPNLSTITYTQSDVPFLPTTADVMETAVGTFHSITSVAANDGVVVVTFTPAGDGQSKVTFHQGITATMLWQAVHLPGQANRWQEFQAELLDGASAYVSNWTLSLGGQAHRDTTPSSVGLTVSSDVAISRPVRCGLPRAVVRTPHLYPYASVSTAGVLWRLGELALHHSPAGRRSAP